MARGETILSAWTQISTDANLINRCIYLIFFLGWILLLQNPGIWTVGQEASLRDYGAVGGCGTVM